MENYADVIRQRRPVEYPQLKDSIYLDHAGTTLIAKTLAERFSKDLCSSLYGNPHSDSPSSQLSTSKVENIRHAALRFFHADPDHFDLVFVANATAGIKVIGDAFRDSPGGFWYGYHADAHTSLVGLRELASADSRCFESDDEVRQWLHEDRSPDRRNKPVELFALPAQSNMNGRRLPLSFCREIRRAKGPASPQERYCLLDAAALVSTSPLNLSNAADAPDFTVLSFYKIFGFPDLGGIIVRKQAAGILCRKMYFGGGTVDVVVVGKDPWHEKRSSSIHAALEDGTLPIHNILALGHAMDVHNELYGSMENVSIYTTFLAGRLVDRLRSLGHGNGASVCEIYSPNVDNYGNPAIQGPVVAFNLKNALGVWVSNVEFEKLAAIHNIHIRTGGLCNPGGSARSLSLDSSTIAENFAAGHRCGGENDIVRGKPTGMIRVSLGVMSLPEDVDRFLAFLEEFYVEAEDSTEAPVQHSSLREGHCDYCVESLVIYPIKSCAGWKIPPDQEWEVRDEGLALDREWCVVHQGTQTALSQKKYPKMARLRPKLHMKDGLLEIWYDEKSVTVPFSRRLSSHDEQQPNRRLEVCGEDVPVRICSSLRVNEFFTTALGVPCQLARFAPDALRHSKAHLARHQLPRISPHSGKASDHPSPIHLSNESPILTISRASLNRLNEQIKAGGGKAAQVEAFRANIVVAHHPDTKPGDEAPYCEDNWRVMQIGENYFRLLGSCRRCQMVCIDQETAERSREPFSTLAKTRRFDGKVWFGQHTCWLRSALSGSAGKRPATIKVGDRVSPVKDGPKAQRLLDDTSVYH